MKFDINIGTLKNRLNDFQSIKEELEEKYSIYYSSAKKIEYCWNDNLTKSYIELLIKNEAKVNNYLQSITDYIEKIKSFISLIEKTIELNEVEVSYNIENQPRFQFNENKMKEVLNKLTSLKSELSICKTKTNTRISEASHNIEKTNNNYQKMIENIDKISSKYTKTINLILTETAILKEKINEIPPNIITQNNLKYQANENVNFNVKDFPILTPEIFNTNINEKELAKIAIEEIEKQNFNLDNQQKEIEKNTIDNIKSKDLNAYKTNTKEEEEKEEEERKRVEFSNKKPESFSNPTSDTEPPIQQNTISNEESDIIFPQSEKELTPIEETNMKYENQNNEINKNQNIQTISQKGLEDIKINYTAPKDVENKNISIEEVSQNDFRIEMNTEKKT